MSYYTLLMRNESIDFGSYSAEDMQKIIADFDAWNDKMLSQGQLIASASLQGSLGKILRAGVVSDGPYSEAREVVGGLFLIQAADEDEAVAIASGCPFLPRGGSIEVRLTTELEFEDAALNIVEAHMQARAEKQK
ncbi:MAG: YciI family protein [Caldilineaceae bacterium]